MKILVTGASGWIGSALVPELRDAGHDVIGYVRSDESAQIVQDLGATVHRGSLDDVAALADAAARVDGVVHLAFKHELAFSGQAQAAVDADLIAIETIGEVLSGSDRPFAIASGVLGIAPGRLATELDGHESDRSRHGLGGRHYNAELVLALGQRGVRSSVVRLPPTCHGDGDGGFMATLVALARSSGVAGYVGDGSNRWPATHRSDVAHVFRLAIEEAPAGSTLHAVAEEGVAIGDVARVMSDCLDVPLRSFTADEATAHFTWLATFIGLDSPVSSERTRAVLGWEPTGPGLLADLRKGHYFDATEPHRRAD